MITKPTEIRSFQPTVSSALVKKSLLFLASLIVFFGLIFWDVLVGYILVTKQHGNDFARFYWATMAFFDGQDMYGPTIATLKSHTNYFSEHLWILNPPHFHLLFFPLSFLPFQWAFSIWAVVNFIALFVSLRLIFRETKTSMTTEQGIVGTLGLLAFTGTTAVLSTGQFSFLLLLLVTVAWLSVRHGQERTAGIYFGLLLSIKLFFLIFIPFFLLWKKHRIVSTAAFTTLMCYCIGFLVFGKEAYMAWSTKLFTVDWAWLSLNASILGILERLLAEGPAFTPLIEASHVILPLWLACSGIIGLLTLTAAMTDAWHGNIDRPFALMLVGMLLISPVGWTYYLFLPIGPLLALLPNWWRNSQSDHSSSYHVTKIRNALLFFAIPGFLLPPHAVYFFQPSILATITLGSAYFFSTFVVWTCLMLDWWSHNHEFLIGQFHSLPTLRRPIP